MYALIVHKKRTLSFARISFTGIDIISSSFIVGYESGNDEKFISFISDNWDKFINDIVNDDYPIKHELRDDWTNYEYINTTTILWATDYREIKE